MTKRVSLAGGTGLLAYAPSGSVLAVGTTKGVRLLDARSGVTREVLPTGPISALDFSRTGTQLAALTRAPSGAAKALVWRLGRPEPRTIAHAKADPQSLGNASLGAVRFTPDGRELAVGSSDKGVSIYRVSTGARVRSLLGGQGVTSLSFDPAGRTLAAAVLPNNPSDPFTVELYDARSGTHRGRLTSFGQVEVDHVQFSPDGKAVAVGGADGTSGLWSTQTHQRLVSFLGPVQGVASMAFSPGGQRVASTYLDGSGRAWRARGEDLDSVVAPGSINALRFAGGRVVAIAGRSAATWRLPGLRPAGSFELQKDPIFTSALSPDGRFAAVTGPSGTRVWDLQRRRLLKKLAPGAGPFAAFSRDSRRLALLAPPPGKPAILDVATGHVLRLEPVKGLARTCPASWRSADFTGDGELVAGATFCGQIYLWNARTGRLTGSRVNEGQIAQIVFAPHGRGLAVGSWDGSLSLFDLAHGGPPRVWTGHTRGIDSIDFSPDGKLLATASLDDTARIWDPATGRTLRILHQPDPSTYPSFSPDGRTLVTGDDANVIRVWDACTACGDADALLPLARGQLTRDFTPLERKTFLSGY